MSLSFIRRAFLLSMLFLICVGATFAQTVIDSTAASGLSGTTKNLFEMTGLIYSGLVILVTSLGQKFGWFSKISQKWVYSAAVGLVLAVVWVTVGFGNFLQLLFVYFPVAGTIYQTMKALGLLGLLGLKNPPDIKKA